MSKSKATSHELVSKIIEQIGDPGGLGIEVLRSDYGGWFAEVRSGTELIPGSGFQVAVDKIVAKLRLQYDLRPYSDVRPMFAEDARRHARLLPPGHAVRDQLMRYARQAEVGPHAPYWVRFRGLKKHC